MIGKRVKFTDDLVGDLGEFYGTIQSKNSMGYWIVRWDNYGSNWLWDDSVFTTAELQPHIIGENNV